MNFLYFFATVLVVYSAILPNVMSGRPKGNKYCGDGMAYPRSCWRYCNGNSGEWCWTDEGHNCYGSSLASTAGSCMGRDCYSKSCPDDAQPIEQAPNDPVPDEQVPADQLPADQLPADEWLTDQVPADLLPVDEWLNNE